MTLTEYVARSMCAATSTPSDAQVIPGPKLNGPKGSSVVYQAVPAWALLTREADLAICTVRDWDVSPELQK